MWSRIKNWWPLAALVALVLAVLGRRGQDKGAVLDAQEKAAQAQEEALDAQAELQKEKIKNATDKELAELAATPDDVLAAAVLAEYRRRRAAAG